MVMSFFNFIPLLFRRYALPVNTNCGDIIIIVHSTSMLCSIHAFPINMNCWGLIVQFHSCSSFKSSFVNEHNCCNILVISHSTSISKIRFTCKHQLWRYYHYSSFHLYAMFNTCFSYKHELLGLDCSISFLFFFQEFLCQ